MHSSTSFAKANNNISFIFMNTMAFFGTELNISGNSAFLYLKPLFVLNILEITLFLDSAKHILVSLTILCGTNSYVIAFQIAIRRRQS